MKAPTSTSTTQATTMTSTPSADPFGVAQLGDTPVTSYADLGGLRLKVINPQQK